MGRLVIVSLISFLVYLAPAGAQYADVLTITTPASIAVGSPVVLRAESPSLPLDTSLVVWSLDGAEVRRGVGATDYTTTFTDTREHEVSVSTTEPGGITRTEALRVHASTLDLVWEAETLVPPLYAGRALPSVESTVRAEARMTGADTSPETHIYTWTLNGKRLPLYSGVGKYTIRIALPPFQNSALIGVSVMSVSGNFTGQTSVKIETREPRIVFYTIKPLIGLWTNTALELTETGGADSSTLAAVPYFMSATSLHDSSLSYTWSLPRGSTQETESDAHPNEVLVPTSAPFSLRVTQKNMLLQEAYGVGYRRSAAAGDSGTSVFGIEP